MRGVADFDIVASGTSFSGDDASLDPVFSSIVILDEDSVTNAELW